MTSITDVPRNSQGVMDSEFDSTDFLPIAEGASDPCEATPGQAEGFANKYKWAEFAGWQGERYLDGLIQAILPNAMFRTWHNLVVREAPGLGAYAGVARLAGIAARSERKIYLDLERFRADKLVLLYKDFRPVPHRDGTYRPELVTIKDFGALYDLAHEFHLWNQDPGYVAPLREHADYIREDPELFAFLIKFECYRKILLCAKPGPKAQPLQRWSTRSLEDLLADSRSIAEIDAKGAYVGKSDEKITKLKKQLFEELSKHSAYRGTSTEEIYSDRCLSIFSTQEEKVGPTTIRSIEADHQPNSETGTEQRTPTESKPNETTQSNGGGAAAKDAWEELGYTGDELRQDTSKRGAALAGVSAEHYAKLNGGLDQQEKDAQLQRAYEQTAQRKRDQGERVARMQPPQIANVVMDYAKLYDEPESIGADIVRALKIFYTAEQIHPPFPLAEFMCVFTQAKDAANKYASKNRNREGGVNRIPYLFTCMENSLKMSLEELFYLRTEDPLYTEYSLWDVINRLRELYEEYQADQWEQQQPALDYREWLMWHLDLIENRSEPKDRRNETAREYVGANLLRTLSPGAE